MDWADAGIINADMASDAKSAEVITALIMRLIYLDTGEALLNKVTTVWP